MILNEFFILGNIKSLYKKLVELKSLYSIPASKTRNIKLQNKRMIYIFLFRFQIPVSGFKVGYPGKEVCKEGYHHNRDDLVKDCRQISS